jgi:isocitrate/isopropylmalate dehydrogenase
MIVDKYSIESIQTSSWIICMPNYDAIKNTGPGLPETSVEAIKDAVMALFGAWADREDMDDSWLDNLRAQMEKGWRERLVELYGNEELSI